MKSDKGMERFSLYIKKDKKYRLRVLALIKTKKNGKRIASADVIRDAIDGALRYNKDEIDAYIANVHGYSNQG